MIFTYTFLYFLAILYDDRTMHISNKMILNCYIPISLSLISLVPTRSPYLYYVGDKDIKVDSINISIQPIPKEYHGGRLLGYSISYYARCTQNSSGQVTVSASTRSYILTGLLPGTQYIIRIAGFTSKGSGPSHSRSVFTSKWSDASCRV